MNRLLKISEATASNSTLDFISDNHRNIQANNTNKPLSIYLSNIESKEDMPGFLRINENEFHYAFNTHVIKKVGPIFNEVINSFFKKINFLGFQLDHSYGNISDELYYELEDTYFNSRQKYNISDLAEKIITLSKLTNKNYTDDEVAIIFNCDMDQAERAIHYIEERITSI